MTSAASGQRTPTFIVIGAMKCATSTVCAYFEDHPETFMVPGADPNYFSYDENWGRGSEYYAPFFEGSGGFAQRGEGSNEYANAARYPDSAARMAGFDPNLKIIYMVRDPLARIRSDWIQRRVDQGDNVPAELRDAVARYPEIYLDQSLYWKNLSKYRAFFSDEAIFLGFMEDMKSDLDAFFAELTTFLGVPLHAPSRRHLNPSCGKRVPSSYYTHLNHLPGTALAKKLLPAGLKGFVKHKVLSRPAQAVPKGTDILPDEMLDVIREDARALISHAGKPPNFWQVASAKAKIAP